MQYHSPTNVAERAEKRRRITVTLENGVIILLEKESPSLKIDAVFFPLFSQLDNWIHRKFTD